MRGAPADRTHGKLGWQRADGRADGPGAHVATVRPVIEDPFVQSALANRISTEVLAYIDVEHLANETVNALAAQGLRPQLVDRLRELTGPRRRRR